MEEIKIKDVLYTNGFNFKKQFGQNFITDKSLLNSIVELSGTEKGSTVVEVGCGAGTLTRAIAARAGNVIAFEIDRDLQPVLAQTLCGVENCEVIFRDFMRVDMAEFESGLTSYTVIANLPYYITTPLIMRFIEQSKKCRSLTVMVQEEVADRLCAKENTADYGAITAAIALRATCKVVKKVPRTLFYPRPNVDSAVVKIDICDGILPVKDGEMYKKVVKAAFLSRRKTLENNLMQAFKVSRDRARGWLEGAQIDIATRGEALSPTQFARLSDIISLS